MYLRLITLLTLIFMSSISQAQELLIFTEELPPLSYFNKTEQKVDGFSVRIVEELLTRTGIKPVGGEISIYPWARAIKIVEEKPNAMLFSTAKTEARTPKFKWVGPIAPRSIWLWKLRERTDIKVRTLEEAKKYITGGVYEFASSRNLIEKGFKVEMAAGVYQNWKKLLAHRIDLITAVDMEAAYYLRQWGRRLDDLEKTVLLDDKSMFYIALNKTAPDELVGLLQAALDAMKSDGTYDRIKNEFINFE